MGEPDDPSLPRSIKSAAKALGLRHAHLRQPVLPTTEPALTAAGTSDSAFDEKPTRNHASNHHITTERDNGAEKTSPTSAGPPASPVDTPAAGPPDSAVKPKPPMPARMKAGTIRFLNHTKDALFYSWINVLLVFVPIGIASKLAHLSPEIIFAMNAVAIVPLAGLLAHATEAVAARLGDALGALLNVSFGNAVELILFIILLADDQIEVVQAALLGSILANLLLIMGMAFVLGGLRYQEQVYNSTITQMSACMLSLAVMSLLLPTAFHAAFRDNDTADQKTLYVSRGTSVVLLLVYALYLVFQLKSHRYLYASTPQHIIDEESHPGVLADMLNSSSSDSSSESSSSSDSDSSNGSHTTAKRIKRAFRNRRRRKSSISSKDTASAPSVTNSPFAEHQRSYFEAQRNGADDEIAVHTVSHSRSASFMNTVTSGDEADTEGWVFAPVVRDFEAGSFASLPKTKREKRSLKSKKKHQKHGSKDSDENRPRPASDVAETNTKVVFADEVQHVNGAPVPKRLMSGLPSLLANNVFTTPQNPSPASHPAITNLRIAGPRTLRRTASMPENFSRFHAQPNASNRPAPVQPASQASVIAQDIEDPVMSRTAAVVMLIISTALVAVCADFLSESIEPMVESTPISQAFIGLIIVPIVGNAAEHVTAVTVAAKNKMDLSIGIAVGSSIQIAIFITPLMVILGWIMQKDMSLYFNIFETVALFVTCFVVNFLVLDGRSNYLEGSLLIAAYVIIALSAFFYPDKCDASAIGGNEGC
ncbi:Sodium/calcium exchanger protein-domain-containing protein [Massariosphaeria phaeospora]|uniref:Sodium/calcium exchanger protein-domain-containing protein n=1 Tax=Massariosphaeria phaeospora TaxID=100035 RepID=A0A7C8M6R8_9PLEO|nr:Sodium/calcium exchanger protein-domain-containing protein [Massariosphaeria phaeospora]